MDLALENKQFIEDTKKELTDDLEAKYQSHNKRIQVLEEAQRNVKGIIGRGSQFKSMEEWMQFVQ